MSNFYRPSLSFSLFSATYPIHHIYSRIYYQNAFHSSSGKLSLTKQWSTTNWLFIETLRARSSHISPGGKSSSRNSPRSPIHLEPVSMRWDKNRLKRRKLCGRYWQKEQCPRSMLRVFLQTPVTLPRGYNPIESKNRSICPASFASYSELSWPFLKINYSQRLFLRSRVVLRILLLQSIASISHTLFDSCSQHSR